MSCYKTYDTTLLSKLPNDVLDHIWSMNHTWAANILQQAVRSFIKTKVVELVSMIEFASNTCNLGPAVKGYNVFYRNKVLNSDDVLKTFGSCNCCARHQTNKPRSLTKWEDLTTPETQWTNCNCSCRHLSRWICREVE